MSRAAAVLPYLVAALPFAWLLLRGAPLGHDLPFELVRIAQYTHALQDGQLPPYWAPDLYAGFGSPIFLFYGHVFLALASGFALLGASFADGMVLALLSCALLGAFAIQRAARVLAPLSTATSAGRVAAYLFLASPYLLGNAFVRNANAELAALCGMPLAVAGVLLVAREAPRASAWLALGGAWVIAAHTLSGIVVVGLVLGLGALVIGFERTAIARWRELGVGLGLSLLLSAWVWLPALVLKPEVRSHELLEGKFDFHGQFPAPGSLFDASTFHSSGPVPVFAALFGCALLAANARRPSGEGSWLPQLARRALVALLVASAALCLMQTPLSLFVWESVGVLAYFQFPWRFAGPLALVAALLGALVFAYALQTSAAVWRRAVEASVLASCLATAGMALGRAQHLDASREAGVAAMLERAALREQPHSSTVRNEYLPLRADPRAMQLALQSRPIVSAAPGTRVGVRADEPRHVALVVDAPAASELCLARWWFGFWQLELDGRARPGSACADGSLRVQLQPGRHRVDARLPVPGVRRAGLAASGVGLLLLLLVLQRPRHGRDRPVADVSAGADRRADGV